jgi:F-type H+-transporting ATPase subunit j
MAFFGLRKWPTPVSASGVMLIALVATYSICILDTHLVPVLLVQVFRPLWPFFAASGITYFLVSKAQDMGVRCESLHPYKNSSSHPSSFYPSFLQFYPLAEGFRNDPRNPYAAQIAKEAHH